MLFQLSLLVSTAFLFYLSFRTFFCPSLPKPSLTIFKSAIVDTLHSCIAPLILLFPYYFQRYPPSIPYPTHPTGLILGLISVAIAQVVIVLYQYLRTRSIRAASLLGKPAPLIQPKANEDYAFAPAVLSHLSQPEGFFLLGSYLTITWIYNLLPASYYTFPTDPSLPVSLGKVFCALLSVDFVQYVMHRLEHVLVYASTHKPHHVYKSPTLFIAFSGSVADTVCMILVPLAVTSRVAHLTTPEYMFFGTLYSSYLTLIHSEFHHRWDKLIHGVIATPADHHVHHRFFNANYGHLFMFWDKIAGTYRDPMVQKGFGKERVWD